MSVIQVTVPTDGDTIAVVLPEPTVVEVTGGGSGAVASVFGRTGVVTAQSGDYNAAQVGADTAAARDTAIGVETAARQAADTAEAATRAAADTANANAIAAETTRAQGVEAGKADRSGPGSTVPRNQLPNISGSFWQQVANQAAMLALTAPDPDTALVVFRTDTPGTVWFLNPGLNPATLGNWGSYQDDAAGAAAAAQSAAIAAAATDATTKANAAQSASQPLDSDLTAIAALSTTAFGRAFLAMADAAATRTALGVPAGSGTSTGTNTGDQTLPTTLPPNGAAGGDLSGSYPNPGVAKLNGTSLAGLGTGLLKNTTGTGVPSIAVAADIPNIAESQVTNLTTDLAAKAPLTGPFAPSSTGATSATRYVGGTTSGSPTSGTFAVGDFVVTQDGNIFICTSAGTPGTWAQAYGAGQILAGPVKWPVSAGTLDFFSLATGTSWTDITSPVALSLSVPASNRPVIVRAKYEVNANAGTAAASTTPVQCQLRLANSGADGTASGGAGATIYDVDACSFMAGAAGQQKARIILEAYLDAPVSAVTLKIQGNVNAAKPTNWTSAVLNPTYALATSTSADLFYAVAG